MYDNWASGRRGKRARAGRVGDEKRKKERGQCMIPIRSNVHRRHDIRAARNAKYHQQTNDPPQWSSIL